MATAGQRAPRFEPYVDDVTGEPGKKRLANIYAENEGDISRLALREQRSWDNMVNVLLARALDAMNHRKRTKNGKKAKKPTLNPQDRPEPTQQETEV